MKITFLGGGNMANALIGGLLQQGFAARAIQVVELSKEGRERLHSTFGVRVVDALDATAIASDIIVLAVKPQHMRAAVQPLAGKLSSQIVVSIAAGLRIADLARWLGGYSRVVRVMPNTPALVGKGIAGLYADASVNEAGREAVARIVDAVGSSVWLSDEAQMDAVTALSGSGPAYVFHFIEALQVGGEALGLDAGIARKLAIETLVGASALAAASVESPTELRERVTSKGGTTEAALASLASEDFAGAVARAMDAAARRGAEMGDQLGRASD